MMYGSTHTHFESRFDTANSLKQMALNFAKEGCHKVAVTEHGVFSSYEDLKDIVNTIKKEEKDLPEEQKSLPSDFEIVPGVEAYMPEHLILIAKDYEGYQSLCHIITDSNLNIEHDKPITTFENLKKNVAKGHVICTSACIGGPFGMLFGLQEESIREKKERLESDPALAEVKELFALEAEYLAKKAERKENHVTKAEETSANRLYKKTGDHSLLDQVELRMQKESELDAYLNEREGDYNRALARLKELGRAKYTRKLNTIQTLEEEIKTIEMSVNAGDVEEKGKIYLEQFLDIFGKDDFYFEIQNHGLSKEKRIYNKVIDFAYQEGHPHFIASNDVHVGITKKDPDYEDMLLKRNVIKFTRYNTYTPETEDDREYVIKNDEELTEELKNLIPDENPHKEEIIFQSIKNIQNILEPCHVEFEKKNHYPKLCDDENAMFESLVREGIKAKFPNGFPKERETEYKERLEYELNVIKTMGYAGYHLIVRDYLTYGRLLGFLPKDQIENAPYSIEELDKMITENGYKRLGYSIGPGRGSAVGSLCCYALGITDIDPIPYNLLFERFLNVERVSMPDIDSDFRTDIRAKVEDYCRAKYGKDCICKIMTKAYGATKGTLRLAARYMGSRNYMENLADGEEVDEKALTEHLKGYYNIADKLAKEIDQTGEIDEEKLTADEKQIVKYGRLMEGSFLNYGQHAAGTIISSDPVMDSLPLMWNSKNGALETQCTMAQAEAKGFLKMDFLGLDNLNIITDILQNSTSIQDDYNLQDYDARNKILTDEKIYKDIFWSGRTQGVFQFESPGMKKMLMDFKPQTFEDLILLVAAYRPGPLQYLEEIIAQAKFNRGEIKTPPAHSITCDNETLQNIIKPTYGCIIYQEQVMQIFQSLAGYSLGGADLVRRAMSKKHLDELEVERKAFIYGDPERKIDGCIKKQGISEADANALFDQMMDFASYAFNKSHATAYALVAFFTAYLKEYHTVDFFRASLNSVKELSEIVPFVKEMKSFGLELLPPSLSSENYFYIDERDKTKIHYGFANIKGFGEKTFHCIDDHMGLQEFINNNPDVSLKTIEKMIKAGMFDTFSAKASFCPQNADGSMIQRGNRHELLEYLNRFGEQIRKCHTITDERGTVSAAFAAETDPDKKASLAKKLQNTEKKRHDAIEKFRKNMKLYQEESRGRILKESIQEQMENITWENELFCMPFKSINSAYMELSKYYKQAPSAERHSFKSLDAPVMTKEGYPVQNVKVPAIICSISEVKKTKKNTAYVDVELMDIFKNRITRRFAEAPNQITGVFNLPKEECKYFAVKQADIAPIMIRQQGETIAAGELTSKNSNQNTEKISYIKENTNKTEHGIRLGNFKVQTIDGVPVTTVNVDYGRPSDGPEEEMEFI